MRFLFILLAISGIQAADLVLEARTSGNVIKFQIVEDGTRAWTISKNSHWTRLFGWPIVDDQPNAKMYRYADGQYQATARGLQTVLDLESFVNFRDAFKSGNAWIGFPDDVQANVNAATMFKDLFHPLANGGSAGGGRSEMECVGLSRNGDTLIWNRPPPAKWSSVKTRISNYCRQGNCRFYVDGRPM